MPVLIKPKNFDAEILSSKVPVLVDFFGERCMPCHMLRPILVEISEEYAGQLKICMFNTDKERQESDEEYEEKFRILADYGVMHLPTMLLFISGELRRTLIGLHTKQELLDVFREEGLALEPRVSDQSGPGDGQDSGKGEQGD